MTLLIKKKINDIINKEIIKTGINDIINKEIINRVKKYQ